MGLDATKNEIIEIGLLSFAFTTTDGIIGVKDTYNALNDPRKLIHEEIIKVTGFVMKTSEDKAKSGTL